MSSITAVELSATAAVTWSMEPSTVRYGTMNDAIAPLFGTSAVRRDVLAWFFARPEAVAHPRELARRLGRSPQVVGRELARLEAAGVLTSETIGRTRRYRVDSESPIAADVKSLLSRTIGPATKESTSRRQPVTKAILEAHRAEIDALCRDYSVRRLDVFGSAVRADFDPKRSDVDFLVEFEPGAAPPFSRYSRLREELAAIVGYPVDLVTARAVLNPYVRAAIDSERQLIYAR